MASAAPKFSPRDLCLVYSEPDPRVSSIRVAERLHPDLHTSRNSKITAFVDRNRSELERYGNIPRRGVKSGERGRPAVEDLLNEDQVTIVCMRSDSKEAADARFEIVQLIRAYRRGEIPQTAITIIADLFDPRPATVTPLEGNVTQLAFDRAVEPERDANARFIDKIAENVPQPSRGIFHYGDYDEDENDPTQGGLLVPRGHYAEWWADGGMSVKRINTPDGVATMFVIGNSNGDDPTRFRLKAPNGASEIDFIVHGPRGSLMAGVVTRAFCSLGPGDYQAVGFAQIRFRLAD
jgi:hypothetical protein